MASSVNPGEDWTGAAVEAALDAIVTIDIAGTIVHVNRAAETLLGQAREAVVGRAVGEWIAAPALRPRAEPESGGPHEARVRRAGQELAAEVTVAQTRRNPALWSLFLREPVAATQMSALLASAEELALMGGWEMDLDTQHARWTDGMYRIHGLPPQSVEPGVEMLLKLVHPDDRDRIQALLENVGERPDLAGPEGIVDEYRACLADGSVRHVRFLGRIECDDRTGRRRWIGSGQDVTAELLTERELRAHYAVSQALREWESFDEGVVDLLRRMATALEYPMASLWLWDKSIEGLRCRALWHVPDLDPGEFEPVMRSAVFSPGEGKPGLAWRRQEPVITIDVATDPAFRPRDAALALGVQSAIAFPAVGPDGPLAVLSLYSLEKRVPSPSLIRTLTGIGSELGRFLSRRRAQLGPRPLSNRELEVLTLAAEGYSGPQIAEELFVSPSTVKTHLEHIYDKLGVGDRAAAVATALRTGLVA
ncbi:LuxR C-terminal-related transcriptional regulator [Solirubrobacter ginsenosidimutans]|uniref:LuxR C-terminal-related transcriptional regulator n=1 Tax=Solirubrobacter ginsenosidimutans TaxID=490573 RepID=A0A9X3MRX0_9ACTN|nr:LuxR C-terminal-related transcriptional regulator [Solirubrobacter ginsenosidimutans]MDA0161350.1 LuxR C-terminal-related transcriptional regulator [Solirubrobacter ginsenosidimutans]